MSDDARPVAAPPSADAPLNLPQQRKRAKDLLRAHRRGEPGAGARVRRHLPDLRGALKLVQAQHVVAREAGFESWPRLRLHLAHRAQTRDGLLESLIAAALSDHRAAVDSALALAPGLGAENLHAAAALGDEAACERLLAETPAHSVHTRRAELGGTALAYVCHARLGREDPAVRASRARIAGHLLAAGADPNECVDTFETPGGTLSVLSAAARHAASAELVDTLLEAGAALEPPGSTAGPPAPPLVGAALGGDLACVERLIRARAPQWQAREALEVAIERDDPPMARALLRYGCLPDQAGRWRGRGGGCLHAAIALGRPVSLLRLLLEGGASPVARDRDGRTPLQIAVQLNELEAAALLRSSGAPDEDVTDLDRAIGACFAGRDSTGAPIARACVSDHQNLCLAVRRRDPRALGALLHAGLDANVADDDGESALHLAVASADLAAVELLIAHGASPRALNYANASAHDLALALPDEETRVRMLELLPGDSASTEDADEAAERLAARRRALGRLFEEAVDRMGAGDAPGLRRLLDREPALATARSARYHRATLLHYLASNGTERPVAPTNAGELARLLLERGAAVDASCRMYGGGPQQTALGLAATTEPSAYPPGALSDLIDALVTGGARIHESDARSSALEGAILYGGTIALAALARGGAKAYDLETAAALEDLEVLEGRLPGASDAERATALGSAACFDALDAMERLLQAGVDPDAPGRHGASALHRAAAADATGAVRFLLARGADPARRDPEHGGTPEDWARHFGSAGALELLRTARPDEAPPTTSDG